MLYSPRNYDGQYPRPAARARGARRIRERAGGRARVGDRRAAIARLLRQAGLSTLDRNAAHYGLGLTLGNAEVRLDELVAAYAMIARGGERAAAANDPRDRRTRDAGEPRRRACSRRARRSGSPTSSRTPRRARTSFGRGGSLEFPFTVAAKTGTSQAYHDNWAIGYTRDVTVGVWVGNFDRTPLRGSSGVTGAGPIFHDVMLAAVERVRGALPIGDRAPIVSPTPDVRRVEVCAESGMRPTDACPTRVIEWVPAGASSETCTWHHATPGGTVTVWPEVFRPWARSVGRLTTASALPPPDAIADERRPRDLPATTTDRAALRSSRRSAARCIRSTRRCGRSSRC